MHPEDAKAVACAVVKGDRLLPPGRGEDPVETRGRNRRPRDWCSCPSSTRPAGRKLTLDATDPLSKETDYKKAPIQVVKA